MLDILKLDILPGKKTLIAVLGLAVVAILEGPLGIDVPGVDLQENWLTVMFEALGFAGVRAAVARRMLEGVLGKVVK